MNEFAYALGAGIAALLVIVLLILLLRRPAAAPLSAVGDAERLRALEGEVASLREGKSDAERRLAAEERTASRVPDLEQELARRAAQIDALKDAKAASDLALATANEGLAQIKRSLDESHQRVADIGAEVKVTEALLESARSDKAKADESLAAKAAALEAADLQIADLKGRMEKLESARADLSAKLEAAQKDKADLEATLATVSAVRDEKSAAVDAARAELAAEKLAHEAVRKASQEQGARLAAAEERLEQELKQAAEKLALLTAARESMANEFKVLAEGVMMRHGEVFTKQNKEQVEGILNPLREKLAEFQLGLQNAHTETAKERATLGEQIRQLTETSAKMTNETTNLTRALKGKTHTQGAWGEMILSTILERSGLREGDEYVKQQSHPGEDGAQLRPDVVVNLPGGQKVVIDAKVSLTAFEEYVNAETEEDRAAALSRHLASLRKHIRTLGGKEYHAAIGNGLDYVVMFVPIEGALAVALQEDPGMTGMAAECDVAIATPTTLMMALRTIANVWHVERRNRNAEDIAARAGKLYDKFVGFIDDLQDLGGRLDQAKESFEGAMGKLSTGRGNIVRQVEQLKELGAKTNKALPPALLEDIVMESLPAPVAAE